VYSTAQPYHHGVQHCTALPSSKDPKPTEMAEQVRINIHLLADTQHLFNEWRKIHSEQFYALYTSSNIIQVIKPRRMSSAGHVACTETGEVRTGFWWGDLRKNRQLGRPKRR
jgi:hypothetical protein